MHNRFEGMYFKQQAGERMLAFIPALHTNNSGKRTASLQVVTRGCAHFIELPANSVVIDRRAMSVSTGIGMFSPSGIELDLKTPALSITGKLLFKQGVKPRGDIMGPYRFVPFMECRHGVFSLTHGVDGSLVVNGETLDFTNGIGYTEGDRGRSFPGRYIWTHYGWTTDRPCSLMLSVAAVRPLGKAFTGIIGFVYFGGREYRLATYCGAQLKSIEDSAVTVRQGPYELTARLLGDGGQMLSAPVSGAMTRLIRESLSCRAAYRFSDNGRVLFDSVTDKASFEFEW